MPAKRETTKAEAKCLMAMRGANHSYDSIAEKVGASRNWVKERCADLGCAGPLRPPADEQFGRVKALREGGHTARFIARQIGCGREAIEDLIATHGLRDVSALPAMHPTTWGAIALPCHARA